MVILFFFPPIFPSSEPNTHDEKTKLFSILLLFDPLNIFHLPKQTEP